MRKFLIIVAAIGTALVTCALSHRCYSPSPAAEVMGNGLALTPPMRASRLG